MPTRLTIEDEIIALLQQALPAGVPVTSLPLGVDEQRSQVVRSGAVWVVYGGSSAKANQTANALRQMETWRWSTLCMAKNYRSSRAAGDAALEILETCITALAGAETSAGRIVKERDTVLEPPDNMTGLIGYEAVFAIETLLGA